MNQKQQILQATRLFSHLDDLCGLGKLTQRECQVLQTALTTLITSLHAQHAQVLEDLEALPTVLTVRSYVLLERVAQPARLLAQVAGEKDRLLHHVPIFCPWGFGNAGYPARDTALAILADFWGETLSRRGFAEGVAHYCHAYLAVAELVERRLSGGGVLRTAELAACLHQERKAVPHVANQPQRRSM